MESMLIPQILGIGGLAFNNVLAVVSAVGCAFWLVGSLPGAPRIFAAIGEWSSAPLYLGLLFQIAIYVTGMIPEQIGFIAPMATGTVNALFALSVLLLAGRWWLTKKHGPAG